MSWTARDHLEELVDRINELLFDGGEFRYDELKWQELSHGPELAAAHAFLDTSEPSGPESPRPRPNPLTERTMTTTETIAKVIGILQMIAMLTPFKYDDTAVEFVLWASDKPWFIALVERIKPASTSDELEAQSLVFEPEVLEGMALFGKQTGRQLTGQYGELLSLILQVIAWVKARKAPPAIPTGT